jgi:superfamily II DNA/RNA helicase
MRKDSKGNTDLDAEATALAVAKQQEIADRFSKWAWEDGERAKALVDKYNFEYNNTSLRKYDGQHIDKLPGMNHALELRPHQKDAIWRIVHGKNVTLAHVVGSGKTFTIIGGAMEMRRLGVAQKPMVVVPKHLLLQWKRSFLEMYPAAKILVPDEKDFTPAKRAEFMSRIATGDWDSVIVTIEQYGKLPMSKKAQIDFIRSQLTDLANAVMAEEADAETRRGNRVVKELEKAKNRLETKLKILLEGGEKDTTLTFEEIGVDYVFADEAHRFKNLFFTTRMTRVAGIPNTESQRATDMFLKTQYLTKLNNGRGVVFATGTPISNTMAEMFTLMRYMNMDALRELNIHNFDAWAHSFGQLVTGFEVTPTGSGFRVNTRFNKFVNLPELQNIFRTNTDVVNQEDIDIPIPKVKGGKATVNAAEISDEQQDYVNGLVHRMEAIAKGNVDPTEDNALKVTTDGRKAALDMRLVDESAEDYEGSKINMAAKEIARIYKGGAREKTTQLVFVDFSAPKKDVFNIYDDLKGKLTALGVKDQDIIYIHSATTDAKKQALFDRMNKGSVRILIGSTPKMGEGMNVQAKLTALHHLDAPWRPSDIEQREGRILRQGNPFDEVEIHRYVTEGTFDAYMWQTLENKSKFIGQVMKGDMGTRSAEDVTTQALSFAEVKALASGNPLVMAKLQVDADLQRIARLKADFDTNQRVSTIRAVEIPKEIENYKKQIAGYEGDIKQRDKNLSETKAELTLEGETFNIRDKDQRKSAQDKLLEIGKRVQAMSPVGAEIQQIGSYLDFPVSMTRQIDDNNPIGVHFYGEGRYWTNLPSTATYISEDMAPVGWLTRIENRLTQIDNDIPGIESLLSRAEEELKGIQAAEGEAFEHEEELKRLQEKSDRITDTLQGEEEAAKPLTIQTTEGEVTVTGERVGEHLAVHIPAGMEDVEGHGYRVSHLPTGAAISKTLPTKELTTELAKALNDLGIDWSFTELEDMPGEDKTRASEVIHEYNERGEAIFTNMAKGLEEDPDVDPDGGTTLYGGFPLQEIARIPKLFTKLLRTQKVNRIANWYGWLRGRQHEDVTVVLKKDYGPQLGWWFRNMDSVLSQTRQGRLVYEAGRDFKQDTIKRFKVWRTRYMSAVDGLTDEEKRDVLNLIDQVEAPEGEGKVVEAAQTLRELTIDVRQYLIDNGHRVGYIEGYLPHIFQGHFWVKARGQMSHKVESIGEALEVADRMATETGENVTIMQDTFIPPDDAQMMTRRAYWRLIKALQENIGESIEVMEDISTTEIHQMISGAKVARPLPRKRFFGNMMGRVVNNPNYLKDLDSVMQAYFYGASRKVHQDILMRKVHSQYEKMGSEQSDLKQFAERKFMPGVLAHPTMMEKAAARAIHEVGLFPGASGQDVRKWMHNVNLIQYVMDLGLSASSAIANASQFFMNAYPIVGEKAAAKAYARAAKIMTKMLVAPNTLNEEQKADLKEITEMGITSAVSSITGEILIEEGTIQEFMRKLALGEGLKGFQEATLMPFSTVELQNRFASYFAGKFWAEQQLANGKSAVGVAREVGPETSTLMEVAQEIDTRLASTEATRNVHWQRKQERLEAQFARLAGVEINDKTQFRVGRENLPFILREAPIRLFSPYKTFLMNQLKFTIDTLRPKGIRTNPKKALRFAGMTLALAGVAGNPIVYGVFLAINRMLKEFFDYDLEEELRKKNLRRGLTGWLGLDISGAVAVWLPDRLEDLLGRFGKIALELGKLAVSEERGAGPLGITAMQARRLKRQFLPAQVQRTVDAYIIIDQGAYVTPLTKTPVALEAEPWVAAIKRFIGMLPKSVSRTFEEEQATQRMKRQYKTLSRDLTERWAQAIKENNKKDLDDVMQFVVKRVDKALNRLKNARNESSARRAIVELLFWKSWMGQQQKFKSALQKKYIPRQIEKPRRLPGYLKPEGYAGAAAAMPRTEARAAAPIDRDTRLAEFRKAYIRAPNMSARVAIKKKVAKWNARHKRSGSEQLIIPWAEVVQDRRGDSSQRVEKRVPPPPSSRPRGEGLLKHRPQL